MSVQIYSLVASIAKPTEQKLTGTLPHVYLSLGQFVLG